MCSRALSINNREYSLMQEITLPLFPSRASLNRAADNYNLLYSFSGLSIIHTAIAQLCNSALNSASTVEDKIYPDPTYCNGALLTLENAMPAILISECNKKKVPDEQWALKSWSGARFRALWVFKIKVKTNNSVFWFFICFVFVHHKILWRYLRFITDPGAPPVHRKVTCLRLQTRMKK